LATPQQASNLADVRGLYRANLVAQQLNRCDAPNHGCLLPLRAGYPQVLRGFAESFAPRRPRQW